MLSDKELLVTMGEQSERIISDWSYEQQVKIIVKALL
jgi:hypothetical protein